MARAYLTLVGIGLGSTALVARAMTRYSDRGGVAIGDWSGKNGVARTYLALVGVGLGRTALVARSVTRRIDKGGVAIGDATIGNATPGPARAVRRTYL